VTISRTAAPAELGFDPARLARIDGHFGRYVDEGKLPGFHVVVTRRGEVVHSTVYGHRDVEAGRPVESDTLWRIYSMTKPVTAVAALILCEEGRFELTDPISRYLPAFADMRVYANGSALKPATVPATEPIRIWHLLTHTSGLTYGFMHTSVVDRLYREKGFDYNPRPELDLAGAVDELATLPLLFEPGTAWAYSMAMDVLARLVEVVSGMPVDEFFAERILRPLGMTDTRWWVDQPDADRLAAVYTPDPGDGRITRFDQFGKNALRRPRFLAGGGGLISTAADYHRFTQMLLRGGELDGVRLIGSRTVRLMRRNHLPGGCDLASLAYDGFSETPLGGIGYGLGVAVVEDPLPSRLPNNAGEFYWGGLASTTFWIDPVDEITTMFFTQLIPSSAYPIRPQLRQLVYAALVD
jgi:CubicO group peptidase (beta-lactamase class C family)